MPKILDDSFFSKETSFVAKQLLGKILCRELDGELIKARIIETEGYHQEDPAAHCNRALAHIKRGTSLEKIKANYMIMYGHPGLIYVYFTYGNYFMLNFVTEKEGCGGAVLIRAVEPLSGIPILEKYRFRKTLEKKTSPLDLTNGPAKLALALNVDKSLNGLHLGKPHLWIEDGKLLNSEKTVQTTRIGISSGQDLKLRFYIKGNPFVSKRNLSAEEET